MLAQNTLDKIRFGNDAVAVDIDEFIGHAECFPVFGVVQHGIEHAELLMQFLWA